MKIGRSIATAIAAHAAAADPHGDRAYSDAALATAIAPLAYKEFFVSVHFATEMGASGGLIDGAGDVADAMLLVPEGFTAITALEVILIPEATGANMKVKIVTLYGAYNGGEDFNVHTETATARDIGATVANQNLAHDISDLVDIAALAVGDLLRVRVEYDATAVATNLIMRGLRLKYS